MIAQLLIVMTVLAVVSFEVFAIIQVFRSPIEKKWRWVLLCLVGVTQLHLAWGGGGVSYNPISVALLGFGVVQSGTGQWVVSVSFPVGALMAIRKAKEVEKEQAACKDPTEMPGNGEHQ